MDDIQPVKHDIDVRMAALMQLQGIYAKGTIANTFNPNSGLFSPGTPVPPMGGDTEPREFEYQAGYNLYIQPRAGEKYGALPFDVLRSLAKSSKEIRLNIEHIKRQIRGLRLDFVSSAPLVRAQEGVYRAAVDTAELRKLFHKPDGEYDFGAWLNMVIEELLVTDAVTLYPVFSMGKLARLRLIDGSTIRPFLAYDGTRPDAPAPAYGQILYGRMSTWYSSKQLIYRPLNTKVYSPYGESPIEWIILAINTAIRHDLQRVGAFTEGNIPGAFMTVPESWTPEQIQQYSDFINAILSGDTNRINKVLFIPGGTGQNLYQFSQNDVDKIEVDKFLMQVACWAFGNDPSEFSLVPGEGLGGKGWTESAAMRQYQNMTKQIVAYLENLFNEIVHHWMGCPHIDVKLIGSEPPQDAALMLAQDQQYMGTVYDVSYVQDRMGIPANHRPVEGKPEPGQQPEPDDYITYKTPAIPKHDVAAPQVDAGENKDIGKSMTARLTPILRRAVGAELDVWREKALRALKKGWAQQPFKSDILPDGLRGEIYARLQKASTPGMVEAAFRVEFDALTMLQPEKVSLVKAVSLEGDGLESPFLLKSGAGTDSPAGADDPDEAAKRQAEGEFGAAILELYAGLSGRLVESLKSKV